MSRVYEVEIFKSPATGDWRAIVYDDMGFKIFAETYLTRWGAKRAAERAVRKRSKPDKNLNYQIEVD